MRLAFAAILLLVSLAGCSSHSCCSGKPAMNPNCKCENCTCADGECGCDDEHCTCPDRK